MAVEHTPGPWEVSPDDPHHIRLKDEYVFCWVDNEPAENEAVMATMQANARLIAAAPDLLSACEAMLGAEELGDRALGRVAAFLAETAIAKATGQASEGSTDQPRSHEG